MNINTHGEWVKFETVYEKNFESGKTYNISVEGNCEFATSPKEPTFGIQTSSINFTAKDGVYLWIRTK